MAWSVDDVDSISLLLSSSVFGCVFRLVLSHVLPLARLDDLTAHAPSAVGVAKAPPPLILFNYIKLQY